MHKNDTLAKVYIQDQAYRYKMPLHQESKIDWYNRSPIFPHKIDDSRCAD